MPDNQPRFSSNVPYLIAIVTIVVVGVIVVATIGIMRPEADNAILYTMIGGFVTTTTAAVLAFMKTQETHMAVNSRLTQFIENAGLRNRAEGELAGLVAGRKESEDRTDKLKSEEPTKL